MAMLLGHNYIQLYDKPVMQIRLFLRWLSVVLRQQAEEKALAICMRAKENISVFR